MDNRISASYAAWSRRTAILANMPHYDFGRVIKIALEFIELGLADVRGMLG